MNIFNCDAGQAAGNCAYRLCWNLDYGLAGYRVGCLENLNSDANRRKVMYKGNEVQTCTSGKGQKTAEVMVFNHVNIRFQRRILFTIIN